MSVSASSINDIPSGTMKGTFTNNDNTNSSNNSSSKRALKQVMNLLPIIVNDDEDGNSSEVVKYYPFIHHAMIVAPPSNKLLTLTKCFNRKREDASMRMLSVVQWVLTNMRNTVKSRVNNSKVQQQVPELTELTGEFHHYADLYLGSRCNTVLNCQLNTDNATDKMNIYWKNDLYGISYTASLDFKLANKMKRVDYCVSGERILHLGKHMKENYRIQLPVIRQNASFFSYNKSVAYYGDLVIECEETAVKAIVSFSSSSIKGSIMEQCNEDSSVVVAEIQGSLDGDIVVQSVVESLPFVETRMNISDEEVREYYPIFCASISSDV